MQNISKKKAETLPIPVPLIAQQEKFSDAVEELETLRAKLSSKSEKLETLFQTLLHRAFSGDLTAEWRKAHMVELLQEMEHQARVLGLGHGVEYEQLGMLE